MAGRGTLGDPVHVSALSYRFESSGEVRIDPKEELGVQRRGLFDSTKKTASGLKIPLVTERVFRFVPKPLESWNIGQSILKFFVDFRDDPSMFFHCPVRGPPDLESFTTREFYTSFIFFWLWIEYGDSFVTR